MALIYFLIAAMFAAVVFYYYIRWYDRKHNYDW